MAKSKSNDAGQLDRDAILKFIQKNPNRADKRSIAKEFGIKGGGRVWLKTLLKQFERDGVLEPETPKTRWQKQGLPAVLPVEVLAPNDDGDVVCMPIERNFRGAPPLIFLTDGSLDAAPGAGDRVLAKIEPTGEGAFLAKPFKRCPVPAMTSLWAWSKPAARSAPPTSAPSMILSLASKIGHARTRYAGPC